MEYTKKFYINAKDVLPADELPKPTPKLNYPIILVESGEDDQSS